jgi:hypothetical protein
MQYFLGQVIGALPKPPLTAALPHLLAAPAVES